MMPVVVLDDGMWAVRFEEDAATAKGSCLRLGLGK
jgi:hypothetical protein